MESLQEGALYLPGGRSRQNGTESHPSAKHLFPQVTFHISGGALTPKPRCDRRDAALVRAVDRRGPGDDAAPATKRY